MKSPKPDLQTVPKPCLQEAPQIILTGGPQNRKLQVTPKTRLIMGTTSQTYRRFQDLDLQKAQKPYLQESPNIVFTGVPQTRFTRGPKARITGDTKTRVTAVPKNHTHRRLSKTRATGVPKTRPTVGFEFRLTRGRSSVQKLCLPHALKHQTYGRLSNNT